MYTILHLYCTREITNSTQEVIKRQGLNIQIISCQSLANAKGVLADTTVNCIIADLHKNITETISFLQEWQKTIDYCRNATVLLANDSCVVMEVLAHIHYCEVYFNETTEKNKEMIASFLKRHYSLHQQLYYHYKSPLLEESIFIKTNEGNINCKLNDILYVEAFKHKCIVHTKEDDFLLPKPLCRLQKSSQFSEFKQSHRSFLVNPIHIKQIDSRICPWVIAFKDCNKQAYVSRSFQKIFDKV